MSAEDAATISTPTDKPEPPGCSTNPPLITPPSNLSHLLPLTPNELLLLSTYERIKQYEKIASKLKASDAKRRLEEADERYRAKKRLLENDGGDGDEEEGGDAEEEGGEVASTKKQIYDDANGIESSDDNAGNETIRKQKYQQDREEERARRELEIALLRADIEASSQKEAERVAARKKVEDMRREFLGEKKTKTMQKKREREDEDAVDAAAAGLLSEDADVQGKDNDNDDVDVDMEGNNHSNTIISGPSIKKKRIDDSATSTTSWDALNSSSLIANISGAVTPPHDFSKSLKMSKTSLNGSVLFPTFIGEKPWRPPNNPNNFMDGCFELDLPNFDPTNLTATNNNNNRSNNTLAIKFHAPQESSRFSINITTPSHKSAGYNSILFHFNPRQFQRGGQLIINHKEENHWGNDLAVPLSTLPLVFGKVACTLIVQINEVGFDVFVEGVHCARLEHRMALLPTMKNNKGGGGGLGSLCLQLPASDDYGNREEWEVYRIWWGHKESMVNTNDLSSVAGVNIYSSVHPKKLFITGLSKVHSDPELDLRRAELERAFRKYGGPNGAVFVSVQKDSTFAFVEVASEQQADLALVEMSGRYRVNKARRTKHEALMEERAAKEAAEKGVVNESVDWD